MIFMTFEDMLEVVFNPERVPDLELKKNIIALCYSGIEIETIWEYILSYDNEGQD